MKPIPLLAVPLTLSLAACAAGQAQGGGPSPAAPDDANLQLRYTEEAKQWMTEALPIGNGHMGAMLFGGVAKERMQFNEESLWVGDEIDTGAYQNFGELEVRLAGSMAVTNPGANPAAAGQTVEAAGDGNPQTKWCMENKGKFPVVWQAAMPAAQAGPVTGYTLTSAEDVPARDPQAWRVLGSQDGQAWQVLDERKDQPVWPARNAARHFIFENKVKYAHYRIEFLGVHDGAPHFQLAEIALDGAADPMVKDYRRALDLNRAVHSVSYTQGGVHYTREAFASFPAGVIAMRFTADKPGAFTADLALADAHGAKPQAEGFAITAAGAIPAHPYDGGRTWPALNYEAQVRVIPQGGKVSAEAGGLHVEGADGFIVLLSAGTDFLQDRAQNWRGALPHDKVAARLDAAAKRPWADLLAEHERDYRRLFGRVSLNLGGAPADLPTDRRMAAYRILKPDLGLEELLFQYGRYLMIASSREGGLPANLQGKWNNSNNPPWRGDYHTDINVEMNYWLTGPGNLNECFQPYADWIHSIRAVRTEATQKDFHARGWLMRGESGLFGGSTWKWTPGTSAWLMQNSFDHYRFTGDKDYLRARAYPAMKEICEHWLDRLEPLPDGRLVAPKSFSPEHGPMEEGVSFEQQVIWDLFTSTIEAGEVLGVDADFRAELTAKRAKLLGPKIGKWGQLQEWMSDLDDPKDAHRHISHLLAAHPGRQISPLKTPELAEAVRVSLTARGDDSTGWSTAWKISQWARLHDGDHAHQLFAYLIRPCHRMDMANEGGGLYGNLFDACPPFQIDGNFGYSAGVCEMLVQSHLDEIHLLPAVPACWPKGEVRGLGARTGVTVDMAWQDGKVTHYTLHSATPQTVRVRVNGEVKMVEAK